MSVYRSHVEAMQGTGHCSNKSSGQQFPWETGRAPLSVDLRWQTQNESRMQTQPLFADTSATGKVPGLSQTGKNEPPPPPPWLPRTEHGDAPLLRGTHTHTIPCNIYIYMMYVCMSYLGVGDQCHTLQSMGCPQNGQQVSSQYERW